MVMVMGTIALSQPVTLLYCTTLYTNTVAAVVGTVAEGVMLAPLLL
jgi:hypothetical protein